MNGILNQGFEGKQTGKIRFTNRQPRQGNLSQKRDSLHTYYVFMYVYVICKFRLFVVSFKCRVN